MDTETNHEHSSDCTGCDACDTSYAGEVAARLTLPAPWDLTLAEIVACDRRE